MGALLEGSDAIANPGADLELGPDEVLLLISRTPEETRRRLDALRALAEAKRRAEEAERAVKLLESGAGQLIEARDAQASERAERLRAGADAALDAVARIDPAIWPWAELLAAARAAGADEILARAGTPPLYPGAWLRVDGRWHEVGRFGWQGTHRTVALREPGAAGWTTRKVAEVTAGATPADVGAARPPEVIDDWQPAAARLVEHTLGNPYRGWPSMGWSSAAPAWLEAAWPAVEDIATTQINGVPATYYRGGHGPAETRFPCDLDGAVYLHQTGGPLPAGARLLPPTADGWRRWLALAVTDDYKLALRDEASRWWWGRPLRPGMQRTRKNPSHPTSRWSARRVADVGSSSSHAGEAMQLPPLTPIGSYLVLGVDHGSRLAWLEHTRTARDAQRAQQDVPADIPLVVIVRVENNALAASRRPAHLAGGDPVFVQPGRLVQDAGLVIAADGRDAISAVVHAKDLDAAYTANDRRVPSGVPRTLIGTVRHRYRSAA